MLNILPLSVLQAWGLWRDFDGVYGDAHQMENVIEMGEDMIDSSRPMVSGDPTTLPWEGESVMATSQMGPGE